MLVGFGSICAGARDCTVADVERLDSNYLTKQSYVGEAAYGGVSKHKRSKRLDPERGSMLKDEVILGFSEVLEEKLATFPDDGLHWQNHSSGNDSSKGKEAVGQRESQTERGYRDYARWCGLVGTSAWARPSEGNKT